MHIRILLLLSIVVVVVVARLIGTRSVGALRRAHLCCHGSSTAGRLDEVAVSTEEQRNRRRTWPAPLQLASAKRHPVGALRRLHLCCHGACTAGRLEEVAVSTYEPMNGRRNVATYTAAGLGAATSRGPAASAHVLLWSLHCRLARGSCSEHLRTDEQASNVATYTAAGLGEAASRGPTVGPQTSAPMLPWSLLQTGSRKSQHS